MIGEVAATEEIPRKIEKSFINSLDLELNRERLSLHNEVGNIVICVNRTDWILSRLYFYPVLLYNIVQFQVVYE